jgi:hypothetical protein
MKAIIGATLLAFTFFGASGARADNDFGVGLKAGTLGIGLEASWQPLPYLDIRVGGNTFEFDDNGMQGGIPYASTFTLESFYATGNLHFPVSPMRITAGIYSNGNELLMINDDGTDLNIGGITYPGAGIGTLKSVTSFGSSSPYFGVGFDFTLAGKLGLNLDFGLLWQGEPEVTLEADGSLAQDPLFQAALEAERRQLEDEMSDFKAWPVVSLGVVYRF